MSLYRQEKEMMQIYDCTMKTIMKIRRPHHHKILLIIPCFIFRYCCALVGWLSRGTASVPRSLKLNLIPIIRHCFFRYLDVDRNELFCFIFLLCAFILFNFVASVVNNTVTTDAFLTPGKWRYTRDRCCRTRWSPGKDCLSPLDSRYNTRSS